MFCRSFQHVKSRDANIEANQPNLEPVTYGKLSAAEVAKMVKLQDRGLSLAAIGKKYSISAAQAGVMIRRYRAAK